MKSYKPQSDVPEKGKERQELVRVIRFPWDSHLLGRQHYSAWFLKQNQRLRPCRLHPDRHHKQHIEWKALNLPQVSKVWAQIIPANLFSAWDEKSLSSGSRDWIPGLAYFLSVMLCVVSITVHIEMFSCWHTLYFDRNVTAHLYSCAGLNQWGVYGIRSVPVQEENSAPLLVILMLISSEMSWDRILSTKKARKQWKPLVLKAILAPMRGSWEVTVRRRSELLLPHPVMKYPPIVQIQP